MDALLVALDTQPKRAAFLDYIAREFLRRDHNSMFWGDRMLTLDKTMGFFEDPAFMAAWERVRGAHEYDQYDDKQSIAWRMHTLVWAARHAMQLPAGDFVECGVFQGDMSLVVFQAAGLASSDRHLHLFDSFEGIDPARAVAGEYGVADRYIEQSNVFYGREGLHESVVKRFAPYPNVTVRKGFLPEALDGHTPDRIAWLHIDLNAAKPEVDTLEVLFDRVVPGGMIILDDYGWLVLRAQKDAEDTFFAQRGYSVLELPTGQGLVVKRDDPSKLKAAGLQDYNNVDDLQKYRSVFAGIEPFSGHVPAGQSVDFLGIRTVHQHLPLSTFSVRESEDRHEATTIPSISDGETWFEAADWVMAAREARDRYVMVTLGANYGAQAVGAARALQKLNPMPFKLVCVEPVPENNAWIRNHMSLNGIDPDEQWLVHTAIAATNDPVLFPVGSPGSGSQNCIATNEGASRAQYADDLAKAGRSEEVMRNLLLNNTTGVITNLVTGYDLPAEIKLVSATTLADILIPFDRVDYVEADMQQSEIVVFPPFMSLLRKKVRRVHIGTHGKDVHDTLHRLLIENGFEIVFSFEPNRNFVSPLGRFATNDGVLTAINPALAPEG